MKAGLHPGQIIAVGTDGIWETCNRNGGMFGKLRFREVIRENAKQSAEQIIEAVYNELNRFKMGLKQADDITLVVVKVKPLPAADDWQI